MSKDDVTCPQAIRTANHRKRLKKWWASKAWKEYVRINTEGKVCEECGCKAGQIKGDRKPATLTVNHLYRNLYNSFEEYRKFTVGQTSVACTTCNWMYERGMDVCPVCKSETVAKYKHFRQPMCSACYKKSHPEIESARIRHVNEIKALQKKLRDDEKARVKEWKRLHPLKSNSGNKPPRKNKSTSN